MKKIVAILLLVVCLGLFAGCGGSDGDETVDLTTENYTYYLSLDTVLLESGTAGGMRYWSKKLTVYGAVSGQYVDCVLYYKIGDSEEKSIKLNASGYGTLRYSESSNNGSFSITRVSGKIIV